MIIGITGLAQSGKSTAAEIIAGVKDYRIVGFADRLKRIVNSLLAIEPKESDKTKKLRDISNLDPEVIDLVMRPYDTNRDQTLRQAYQNCGMFYRAFDHDYWLAGMPTTQVIIPDLRFNNEALWLKRNNGIIIKIIRPGIEKMDHPSEEGIKVLPDWVIMNDGTIYTYTDRILALTEEL